MADSSLVGVIVGGIIGIAGGVIGPLVLEWRKGISDNRKRRQDRLIELIYAIYEHHHWIQHLYEIKVKGETGEISPTHMQKLKPSVMSIFLNWTLLSIILP